MSIAYNTRIIRDGLILSLDGGNIKSYPSTGVYWYDLTNQKNIVTMSGSFSVDPANGGSILYNGTDTKGLIPHDDVLQPNIVSVSAWVQHTDVTQDLSFICGGGDTSLNGYFLSIRPASNTFKFAIRTVNSDGAQFETSALSDSIIDQIMMVSGTYDGSTVRIYHNADIVLEDTITATGNINYADILTDGFGVGDIGSLGSTSVRYWTGNIYTINVYNRALSSIEIAKNFNATRRRFGV